MFRRFLPATGLAALPALAWASEARGRSGTTCIGMMAAEQAVDQWRPAASAIGRVPCFE